MLYTIRRIEIWPVMKIVFLSSLIVGVIISLLYIIAVSFITNIVSTYAAPELGEEFFQLAGPFSFGIMLMLSLSNALTLTIVAVILIVMYNLISSLAGGLEIDLQSNSVLKNIPSAQSTAIPPDSEDNSPSDFTS